MATLAVMPAPDREAVETRRTLADHVSGVEAIIDTIEGLDDESLTDEDRTDLSEMLIAELAGTRKKVDNVSAALSTWESLEAAATREIERLDARRTRFARSRQRLTDYVLATMEASNLPKLEGDFVTLTRRLNPPSVLVDDAEAIPGAYMRVPPVPAPQADKTAIKAALKAGADVPGARLIQTARLCRS